MSKMNLSINESAVGELTSLNRVFVEKDGLLSLRIGAAPKTVDILKQDGSKVRAEMTQLSLFTSSNGEVVVHNMFVDKMAEYPDSNVVFTVVAKDFFTALGAFASVEGGVYLNYDSELPHLWFVSPLGNIKLKIDIAKTAQFSKAKPLDGVKMRVDGNQFRRCCSSMNGMFGGFAVTANGELMIFGSDEFHSNLFKGIVATKTISGMGNMAGVEHPVIEIGVTSAAMGKIISLFKGDEIDIFISLNKLFVQDRYSWYEVLTVSEKKCSVAMIEKAEVMAQKSAVEALLPMDAFKQALGSMDAANAILASRTKDAIYLYVSYKKDEVKFELVDNSCVSFKPAQLKFSDESMTEYKVAFSLAALERELGRLGACLYCAQSVCGIGNAASLLVASPVVVVNEGGRNIPRIDGSLTTYSASIGNKDAYGEPSAPSEGDEESK